MKQREIKFKAWDNKDYMSNPFTIYDVQLSRISFTKDVLFIEFTGLLDKNGKDIYDGDILQSKNGKNKVCYLKGCFGCMPIVNCDEEDCFVPLHRFRLNYFEVLGNIYENPELLTDDLKITEE